MEINDELDIEKLVQDELDAISLDDSIDDIPRGSNDDDDDYYEVDANMMEDEQTINETRRILEDDMRERLAAFESEVKANLARYEIDYSEIDELLKKPTGTSENDIQTNVARECGIKREELDRILQSINAEEAPLNSSVDSDSTDYDDPKIEFLRKNLALIETNKSIELTARTEDNLSTEEEDPNKKFYDERIADSHRRMLHELALLDQRRKEEEERYAVVLQEQQVNLAEEYRRLQATLNESAQQTQNEKVQFETLCREQARLTNERQNKMATIIQAWYRGKRIYHEYHGEILQRVAPTLRSIAKKRKKKEQEAAANASKLAKIQEEKRLEKENQEKLETNSIVLPMHNRISSPIPDIGKKNLSQEHKISPLTETTIPSKENIIKKKTIQPKSQNLLKQTSNSLLPVAQVVQLENPLDFIPTIMPEKRTILSPRKIQIENKNSTDMPELPSSIQSKEKRQKSSNKRQNSARSERLQNSKIENDLPLTHKNVSNHEQLNTIPIETITSTTSLTRSNTFEKKLQSPRPSDETISTSLKSIHRSDSFLHKETEIISQPSLSPPPPIVQSIDLIPSLSPPPPPPIVQSIDLIPSPSINRSNTFTNKSDRLSSASIPIISSIDIKPQPDVRINNYNESISSFNEQLSTQNSMDKIPFDYSSIVKQTEMIQIKSNIPITPRISTPRKVSKEEQYSTKKNNSFLHEACCWAENTRDINYANLITSIEEINQQLPSRKVTTNLRKFPDIDSQLLTKATKSQSSKETRYLLLEQILIPCTLSLIGATYPHLTHLVLRQCKLVQLIGLDSCKLLTVLDIEGNWLEQIHIQLNRLEYLNMSRNRITSLLSMNTPCLKYLDVSKNRLTRLNGIEKLRNLNILLATSNQLLTTIGLQGCTNLLYVDVSDNHLVEMEQLEQCPLLITIKANSNALIQMPNLINAILLNEVDLSSNSLTAFDELSVGAWLPFLTHLHLSSNNLQELSLINLPSLIELDLGFNQIFDATMLKRFIKDCPLLSHLNLEQNPVLCDINDSSLIEEKSFEKPLSLLPSVVNDKSSKSIELYLDFLSNMNLMFIKLRQTVEQHQIEPFNLLKSIHNQCQQYYEHKIIEAIEITELDNNNPKTLSVEEQSIIRLQAHWRRRLIQRILSRRQRAARKIQAYWRGYTVRQRMRNVRRLFSQQQQQTFDEIDLTQFDFDEAAFEARFQRPCTPKVRAQQAWQPPSPVFANTTSITEIPHPNSSRTSSAASSRAKPILEPLSIPTRTHLIADEWGFAPASSTAALMLKRAEKMKWNAERKHKREHMDAYQRLQIARQSELPPGSLRLARRQTSLAHATKAIAQPKTISPPVQSQPRANRVFEWVHTQVARFDDSSLGSTHSPRNERKRLPSLDGSTDSMNHVRSGENLQQQRWSSSTVSVRQPPPLLPPINGHLPRV